MFLHKQYMLLYDFGKYILTEERKVDFSEGRQCLLKRKILPAYEE